MGLVYHHSIKLWGCVGCESVNSYMRREHTRIAAQLDTMDAQLIMAQLYMSTSHLSGSAEGLRVQQREDAEAEEAWESSGEVVICWGDGGLQQALDQQQLLVIQLHQDVLQ